MRKKMALALFLDLAVLTIVPQVSCGDLYIEFSAPSWMLKDPTLEDEWLHPYFRDEWWVTYAYAESSDGKHLILLNLRISRHGTRNKIYVRVLDSKTGREEIDFHEMTEKNVGIIVDNTTRTIYAKGLPPDITLSLRIHPDEYRIHNLRVRDYEVVIESNSRGIPFWLGTENITTLTPITKDEEGQIFYMGGYVDCVDVKIHLTYPNGTAIMFDNNSYGVQSHVWTYPYIAEHIDGGRTDLAIQQSEFYLFFQHEEEFGEALTHRALISFREGDTYIFTDFEVETFGNYHLPSKYTFRGNYEMGTINLEGERLTYLMQTVNKVGEHPYVKFSGNITKEGKTINVDAYGTGENMWFSPPSWAKQPPSIPTWLFVVVGSGTGLGVIAIVILLVRKKRK